MKTLIVNIDRDDDLGQKTGIRGPVVGRKAVLKAAHTLLRIDPEESDGNAMYGAVHLQDRMVRNGHEVEVAVLTGHRKVGERSDLAVAAQLDDVLFRVKPDRLILVTDGADDNQLLPLLTSRARVDHVHEVYVRQARSIESTWVYVTETLKSPRFGIPFALVFMLIGLLWLSAVAFQLIPTTYIAPLFFLVFGVYWLLRAARVPERLQAAIAEIGKAFALAKFTPIASLIALFLLLLGTAFSYNYVSSEIELVSSNFHVVRPGEPYLVFLMAFTPWGTVAGIVRVVGVAVDKYLRHKRSDYASLLRIFPIVAIGSIVYGLFLLGRQILFPVPPLPAGQTFHPEISNMFWVIVAISFGIGNAIAGALVYRSFRQKATRVTTESTG